MKQTTQANFYLIILFLCCASIFASNITDNYGKKVLEKSPVLYLRFDGSYSDSSQNGFDATADGNVSTVSKSDFPGFSSNNKAAYLTGGWLKVSSLTKSNLPNKLPNTLTTEAWVSATQFQTWTSYIGYYQDNGPYEKGWLLGANNSKAIFPVAANLNNLNYDPGYSGMELNTWYHIVGVYDGSKVKIYINGDYVTEHSRSGDHDYNHGTYGNDYLRIGIYKDYDEHFAFKGYIDEVAIYDYALSSAEIKEHYDIATIDLAVSLVAISSATNIQSGILNAGDSVTVTVTMSEPTTVSGTPQIGLQIGSTTVQADYASGSGSTDLLFVYVIQAGQTDPDGISIDADSLTFNNGSLTDTAGNNATLTHTAVVANSSYKVDTTATISLLRGVNMIGLPLKPDVSYTAKSLSQHLSSNSDNLNDDSTVDVTWVIRYPSSNKKFEAYVWSLDQTHDGFEIQGGRGYIVHVSSGRDVVFEGGPWSGVLNPISAPSSVIVSNTWAFVVSGNLTSQIVSSDEGYRLQATNLTTGKQLAEVESIGHSFRLPLVDLNRQDLVVEGDLVEVKLIDSNGRRRANSRFQVGQKELSTAHRWLELESNPVPDLTRLLQNYPNPFNPETWIPYQLSQDSEVKIWIYDVGGQLVRSMEVGFKEAGIYSSREKAIYWDGKNQDGEPASSGVYFYILEIGTESQTKQMVILK